MADFVREFPSGEYELIASLKDRLSEMGSNPRFITGIGDDAAVRVSQAPEQTILTTDISVEHVHFSLAYMTLREIGYRAMVANLSDCAAMSAIPDSALVQLVFPKNHAHLASDIGSIYDGFGEACSRYDFPVVGGDLSQGPSWSIGITLIGRAPIDHRILRRTGIRPGDSLWVSGIPGRSAAGLGSLLRWGRNHVPTPYEGLVHNHVRPEARVETGYLLGNNPLVHAMMDLSDGLSKDCRTLCYDNKLGLDIHIDSSQIPPAMVQLSSQMETSWIEWFLHGGEDYELLFTAAPEFAPESILPAQVPMNFRCIGQFTTETGIIRYAVDSDPMLQVPEQSWDHVGRSLL